MSKSAFACLLKEKENMYLRYLQEMARKNPSPSSQKTKIKNQYSWVQEESLLPLKLRSNYSGA